MSGDAEDAIGKELANQNMETSSDMDLQDTDIDNDRTLGDIMKEGDCFLPQLPIEICDSFEVFEVGVADDCEEDSCSNLVNTNDSNNRKETEGDDYSQTSDSMLDLDTENALLEDIITDITEYSLQHSEVCRSRSRNSSTLNTPDPVCLEETDSISSTLNTPDPVCLEETDSISSTLNTPDPVCLEETDSISSTLNTPDPVCLGSSMPYSQFQHVEWDEDGKGAVKGVKRKLKSEDFDGGIECIHVPNHEVNLSAGNFIDDTILNAANVLQSPEGYQHCQYNSSCVSTTMPPSLYAQSSVDTSFGGTSCRFNHNQSAGVHSTGFNYDIGPRIVGSSAAYRIDFSSPVPFIDTIPMIVSQPSYLPSNVTRPLAIPASGFLSDSDRSFLNDYLTHSVPYSESVTHSSTSPYSGSAMPGHLEYTGNNNAPSEYLDMPANLPVTTTSENPSMPLTENINGPCEQFSDINTNSPVSAFCAVLDLAPARKKRKETEKTERDLRNILPRFAKPSIPVQTFLNQVGPTLTHSSDNVLVPYMNSVYPAFANSNNTNTCYNVTSSDHSMERFGDPTAHPLHSACSSKPQSMTVGQPASPSVVDANWALNAAVLMSNFFVAPVRMNIVEGIPLYTLPKSVPAISPTATQGSGPYRNSDCAINNSTRKEKKCAINLSTRKEKKQDNGLTQVADRKLKKAERRPRLHASAPRKLASADALSVEIKGDHVVDNTIESKSVITYLPPPDPLKLRSNNGTDGRKVLKAQHYHFRRLEIGNFKFQAIQNGYDDIARLKFFFRNKKMVYEFQLAVPDDEPLLSSGKHLIKIEVPLTSIVGLWLFRQDLRVEVDEVPDIYIGVWNGGNSKRKGHGTASYNRKHTVDITHGELAFCPYHYIQFRSAVAWRITGDLLEFDSKFAALLKQPFLLDPKKMLQKPRTGRVQHYLLDPSIELPVEEEQNHKQVDQPVLRSNKSNSPSVSCDCQYGCKTIECPCCEWNVTCTEGACSCTTCYNPLNILHQMGLPQSVVKMDQCLMDNVYQVKHLDLYVKTQLMLECCQIPMLLLQCIPGQFACPNCSTKYKFSWCQARLCSDGVAPRNHCSMCAQCSHHRNQHCERCNVCYYAGDEVNCLTCPVCQNAENNTDHEDSSDLPNV